MRWDRVDTPRHKGSMPNRKPSKPDNGPTTAGDSREPQLSAGTKTTLAISAA
jgi:hypothetical protein